MNITQIILTAKITVILLLSSALSKWQFGLNHNMWPSIAMLSLGIYACFELLDRYVNKRLELELMALTEPKRGIYAKK